MKKTKWFSGKAEEDHKAPSYKLDISIHPWWFKLYKMVSEEKNDELLLKEIETKEKKVKDTDLNLYGRLYHFTEYYDSVSGLTTRFQKIVFPSGKQIWYPVDEFGDQGYFFNSDASFNVNESSEDGQQRIKLSVDIGDSYICNDIFNKHEGGLRIDFYEKENYLFDFPLNEIFNFLVALGQRFNDAERNMIIKWPDHIEKKFKELGIKYETYLDYEPECLDIEGWDNEFFEKWGKPSVSLYSNDEGSLMSEKDGTIFGVKLKIFRPGENDRFSGFTQEKSLGDDNQKTVKKDPRLEKMSKQFLDALNSVPRDEQF